MIERRRSDDRDDKKSILGSKKRRKVDQNPMILIKNDSKMGSEDPKMRWLGGFWTEIRRKRKFREIGSN